MSCKRRRGTVTLLDYEAPDISPNRRVVDAGQLLRTQCTHRIRRGKRRGRRCPRITNTDYRICDKHLASVRNLRVSASRLGSSCGLGLFAVCDNISGDKGIIVFKRGSIIDCFAGELIDNIEYARRYAHNGGFAQYALGVGDDLSHDESYARTALSYANDAVDTGDVMMRRNYVFPDGTHTVWHHPDWPHVVNCACDVTVPAAASVTASSSQRRACLVALCDIRDGDEILWSYSGSCMPSKDKDGEWIIDPATDMPVDAYWYGSTQAALQNK